MNKNALKKFAMEARERLIEQVTLRADYYGLTEKLFKEGKIAPSETYTPPGSGELLTAGERAQRDALHARMKARGYDQAIEEGAYTWFNRFIALKYMQEKGRLPVSCRALPSERLSDGTLAPPELVYRALEEERLEGIDAERVLGYLENSQTEALYKYLLIALCNQLSEKLPRMFEPINDYTELLFPDRILGEESVLGLLAEAPADSWEDIQVIGWLYQYYISERHDQIVNINGGAIKKDEIPPATCLYTTDWVVRYMVENSLGRLYIEGLLKGRTFESEKHRIAEEKRLSGELGWAYYLPEAEQTAEVRARLQQIERETNPEKYTVLDPCMGSGHILVYAFDALMTMYRRAGYTDREAVQSILERNLYGLDIDERAAQLAYFALMMRACDYDARFIRRAGPTPQPHVQAIYEAEQAPDADWSPAQRRAAQALTEAFADAREYGSILRVDEATLRAAQSCAFSGESAAGEEMRDMASQAVILAGQYDAVITNPPYLNKFDDKLKKFIQGNYADYKADLFSVFMYRNFGLCKAGGYTAFMSPFVWMFIKSYEALRQYILTQKSISSLIQMEYSAFEEATVPICTFVLRNVQADYSGTYLRLSDFKGGMEVQRQKVLEAQATPGCPYRYTAQQDNFRKIPGSPVAYWVGERFVEAFESGRNVGSYAKAVKGLDTCDNDRFVRQWEEVSNQAIGFHVCDIEDTFKKRWYPYTKGGGFRRWYGFNEMVVDWRNNGEELRNLRTPEGRIKSRPQNTRFYFKTGMVWSSLTSYKLSMRHMEHAIFGGGGTAMFCEKDELMTLGLLNSSVGECYLSVLNPTINFLVSDIMSIPTINETDKKETIGSIVEQQVGISKQDWDSFETSWDFKKHPLV